MNNLLIIYSPEKGSLHTEAYLVWQRKVQDQKCWNIKHIGVKLSQAQWKNISLSSNISWSNEKLQLL